MYQILLQISLLASRMLSALLLLITSFFVSISCGINGLVHEMNSYLRLVMLSLLLAANNYYGSFYIVVIKVAIRYMFTLKVFYISLLYMYSYCSFQYNMICKE